MKRLIVICILLVNTLAATAQSKDYKWSANLSAGPYGTFLQGYEGFIGQLAVDHSLSNSFDLSLLGRGNFYNPDEESPNISYFALNLRYKFFNNILLAQTTGIRPFFQLGAGLTSVDETSGFGVNADVGIKIHLAKQWNLIASTGFHSGPAMDKYTTVISPATTEHRMDYRDSYWNAQIGVSFLFGTTTKDSDKDGVPDDIDECPDTPKGVRVDLKGCPRDSDEDGIPDYLDKCPNEGGGVIVVDEDGCPYDSDGDGVPDHLDECPDLGGDPDAVEENGCPKDADKDGVYDFEDDCPDVPGLPELNGCPKVIVINQDSIDAAKAVEVKEALEDEEVMEAIPIIYFDFDKYNLNHSEIEKLVGFLRILSEKKGYSITVDGYTDNIGSQSYNVILSQYRANAVKQFMVNSGLESSRILTRGFGSDRKMQKEYQNHEKQRCVIISVYYVN